MTTPTRFFCPQCNLHFDDFDACSTHIETGEFQCSKWRYHPELEDRCRTTPSKNTMVNRLHGEIKKRTMPLPLQETTLREGNEIVLDADGMPLVNAMAGQNIRGVLSQNPTSGRKSSPPANTKVNDDLFLSFEAPSSSTATRSSSSSSSSSTNGQHGMLTSPSSNVRGIKRKRDQDTSDEEDDDDDQEEEDQEEPDEAERKQPNNPLLRLHNEILDFVECIQPTAQETANRMRVVTEIEEVARELWENNEFEVKIFGSTMTGLALPTSDVDIVVIGLPYSDKKCILKLGNELKRRNMVSYIELITGARVPIIKMTHLETGMDADICFNQSSGPKMGHMIKHMLSHVPAMKPLVLVLKYFLQQRNLNVTFKGGVGSFLLQLMVISSIQHHAKVRQNSRWKILQSLEKNLKFSGRKKAMQQLGKEKAQRVKQFRSNGPIDLGTMLLEFLEFYGRSLDTTNVGISVRGQGSLYRKNTRSFYNPNRTYLLSLENPENPNVDIGANSYGYKNVNRAISNSYETIKAKLNEILNADGKSSGKGRGSANQQSLLNLIIDVDAARTDSRTQTKRGSKSSGGRNKRRGN